MTLASIAAVCRLAVGLTFLVSGGAKLAPPRAFVEGVAAYRILPPRLSAPAGWIVIGAELLSAVSLLAGRAPVAGALLAVALGAAFAVAVGINLARGLRVSCRCFGAGEPISARTLVRIGLLMAAAVVAGGLALAGHAPVAALWSTETLAQVCAATGLVLLAAWSLAASEIRVMARVERSAA